MRLNVNLMRVDLSSLRLAVFCADLGSLSAAARGLSMSIPRASYRLNRLEASFGCLLFERRPDGMKVTPAGVILVDHGRRVLEEIRRLDGEIRPFNKFVAAQQFHHE